MASNFLAFKRILILRRLAKLFFDSEKPVIFGCTLSPTRCTRLYLPCIKGHCYICNHSVFCFSGPVRYDSPVPCLLGSLYSIKSFGQGSYLVYFHKNGIGYTMLDSLFQSFCIRNKKIISNQLNLAAQSGS